METKIYDEDEMNDALLCSEQVEFVEVMVKAFLSLDKKRGNELGMKQGGEIGE